MKLNLRIEWIRKLKNKGVVEDYKWGSPEQWRQLEIERLTSDDLDVLMDLMEKNKEVKGTLAVKQKITTYLKLKSDSKGVKISRLEPLVMAVRELMLPTPHKWLFSENSDGYLVPWYVYDADYAEPDEKSGRAACTTVSLAATRRGSKVTKDITFHSGDLGDTAHELLRKRGYFVETPEIVEVYKKENERYQAICGLTGEQFDARGEASERDSWHSSSATSMEVDGKPSLLVMDDESDEGEGSGRGDREVITAKFWVGGDAEESGADPEESHVDMPLQPYVKMFDLKKHVFVTIHVGNLKEYVYDATVIEKLVLPPERKELVEILVTGADTQMEDIIKGKTGGIIVVCTGDPGTGKTLTAEAFSEQVKRPLYRVQCSQLGTDEVRLEKALKIVLGRAERWKAILLIDEADVYVHERGTDIQQNAIVGVFLRVLEYYQGIMFLTSNRATVIDDAILSRATAWIRYDLPDRDKAQTIWKVLSVQYKVVLSDEDTVRLVDTPAFKRVSGRTIKNMLRLAKLMATRKRKSVTVETLVYVSQFIDLEPSTPPTPEPVNDRIKVVVRSPAESED